MKPLDKTLNVLNRMKKAFETGKGMFIKADELQDMHLSFFGELWDEEDPRCEEKNCNITNRLT